MNEIFEQRHLMADSPAATETAPAATGYLTRAALEAAVARIGEPPMLSADPARVRAELALVRYLDEQPPGTAEKLLRQALGAVED